MRKPTTKSTAADLAALAERFVLIRPDELSEPVPPMEWLIRGVWPLGSYGPFGGAKKTLKTYIASGFALAVAAGKPAFNNEDWAVPEARPVIYYGGEGGRRMHQARLQRIARDLYGIEDLSDVPLYLVTDIGPFDRPDFKETLARNLAEVSEERGEVGLVVLDSLYNYHPADIEVSNLYERGRLLGGLSAPLVDQGTALWVVDHFNKTGSGIDLDRLAQSGMSAWADSWLLFEHGADPDVPNGVFAISTGIGSRHWGGDEWTLHLDIGPFDKETGLHLTPMKVEAHEGITKRGRSGRSAGFLATDSDIDAGIVEFVRSNPDQTKREIVDGVMTDCAIGRDRAGIRFAALAGDGRLVKARRKRREGAREVSREVWDAPLKVRAATRPVPGRVAPEEPGSRNPTGNPTRPDKGRATRP